VRDYNAAKFDVASGEFSDVIHYYPMDDMAAQRSFTWARSPTRQKSYSDAVKAYNAVLEGFPATPRLRRAIAQGLALLAMNKREAGITGLRSLISHRKPRSRAGKIQLNG